MYTYFEKALSSEKISSFEKEIFRYIVEFTLHGGNRIRTLLVQICSTLFQPNILSNMLESFIGFINILFLDHFPIHDDIMNSSLIHR